MNLFKDSDPLIPIENLPANGFHKVTLNLAFRFAADNSPDDLLVFGPRYTEPIYSGKY